MSCPEDPPLSCLPLPWLLQQWRRRLLDFLEARRREKEDYQKWQKLLGRHPPRCSTPLAPVPNENCLTTCDIAPISRADNEISLKKNTNKWSQTPSDNESRTFLHNWEKILTELRLERPGARNSCPSEELRTLDSL